MSKTTKNVKRRRTATSTRTAYQRELMKHVERLADDYDQFAQAGENRNAKDFDVFLSWVIFQLAQFEMSESRSYNFSSAA